MPPPVPVNPESNPMPAPVNNATGFAGGWISCASTFGSRKKRTAEYSNTTPTRTLNQGVGKLIYPPRNASGMDSTANGQNNDHEKCPARQN